MKLSFFDAIGMADMERLHSQMLSWIFSRDCEGIDQESKINVLSNFKDDNTVGEIEYIFTEYKSIDLLILTSTYAFVFENKLKSSQHSNQLLRYAKIIEENFPHLTPYYIFLTLVPEIPEDERWVNLTFKSLLGCFKDVEFKENTDGVICKEYFNTIQNFSDVVDLFLEDHRLFKNVFTDIKMTKANRQNQAIKLEYNEIQQFINVNRLGVMLQKALMRKILLELNLKLKCKGRIDEYNGIALIHLIVQDQIMFNGVIFETALQVQGDTCKFIFQASDYPHSKQKWVTEEIVWLFDEMKINSSFTRRNIGKTKALISLSKKFEKPLYEMSFTEVIKLYEAEYAEAIKLNDWFLRELG